MKSLLIALLFATSLFAGDWPQWRGPKRDGYAPGQRAPVTLPKEVKPDWKINVGGGFSSPVLVSGKLVYLDEDGTSEIAHAIDANTGKEIWKVSYAARYSDEWGAGPRATPIIDDGRVYVQACNGDFKCLNLADGKEIWKTSFEKDWGVRFLGSKANEGTASRRGNNGSGVIDGDRLFLPVGNTDGASLVAFDKKSGKVLWKGGNDEAGYASLMVGTLADVRQVVAFNADALVGADAESGKILWRVPLKTNAKRHAATPVIFGDHVVVSSHTFGVACFKIGKDSGGLVAKEAWINKDARINLATLVLVDGHLYSQGPAKDYICLDAVTGELKWSQPGFGQGRKDYASTIVVDKKLLVLAEDGQLLLLEPNPAKYTELARLQVCGNTWCFPAYADGKLYVRDGKQLMRLTLAAQ
jgi:outer membrane protein assembly factor BamB